MTGLLPFLSAKAMLIHLPENFSSKKVTKVLVVIHGCLQSAESISLGSGFNEMADKKNFVIIYPQVEAESNYFDCWNWFLKENHGSKKGQLSELSTQIQDTLNKLSLKDSSVYLIGMSSGGASAAGLVACFPDQFKGVALISSPTYASASNVYELEGVLKKGPMNNDTRKLPCSTTDYKGLLFVSHGEIDTVVNYKHALGNIDQILDKNYDSSITNRFENSKKYSKTDYKKDNVLRARFILIKDLGHTWAGYGNNFRKNSFVGPSAKTPTVVPFFSKDGPNLTKKISEFFKL